MNTSSLQAIFIPALLCDEAMYREVIVTLGNAVDATVMISPMPRLEDSVADILARAPATFVLAGTSYGGNLAIELALAAPERVTALWLMGCDPRAPQPGGPDLAGGLEAAPDAVIDKLSGVVVNKEATAAAATFKAMAHRLGGAAGAAQARAVASRREATSRLARLKMPTLVLWGQDDAPIPVSIGRALAAGLPDARFHAVANCGHLPTLEKPVESAARFGEFLREIAGQPR